MGSGSVDTTSVPGAPSSETAEMQSWGPSTSCQCPLFSGPPSLFPPNGSSRFWCTIFTLPSPAAGWSWKLAAQYMVAPQPDIWYFPTVLNLLFPLKGCPFEKDHITHSSLSASYFMITVFLMPFIFLLNDMLGSLICPLQSPTIVVQIWYLWWHSCPPFEYQSSNWLEVEAFGPTLNSMDWIP